MVKTLNILLVVLGLACFAQAVPSEDKVVYPSPITQSTTGIRVLFKSSRLSQHHHW